MTLRQGLLRPDNGDWMLAEAIEPERIRQMRDIFKAESKKQKTK